MLYELLVAAQLSASVLTLEVSLPANATIDISRNDVICLSERLAEEYQEARSNSDATKLDWYSSGCSEARRGYDDQTLVRLTSYGAVIKLNSGRLTRERYVLFAEENALAATQSATQ